LNTKILVGIVAATVLLSVVGLVVIADQDDGLEGDIVMVDDRGKVHTFDKHPERIASLGKPFTNILIEIGAGESLVAVDSWSEDFVDDYPDVDLSNLSIDESIFNLDPETVLKAEPDVVLTYDYGWGAADNIAGLESLDLKVLAYDPGSYGEVIDLVSKLGELSGKTDEAKDRMAFMAKTKIDIETAVEDIDDEDKPKVYFELANGKAVNYGRVTDSMIELAGGINIARNESAPSTYAPADESLVISWDVDIIIVEEKHPMSKSELLTAYDNPSSDEAEVYRLTHGYNTYDLNLVKGLIQIAEYLHPDLFDFS